MRAFHSFLVAALASVACADVKFTIPAAGASLVGGGTISIAWEESGVAPLITTFSSYQIFLMAGGNDPADSTNAIQVGVLVSNGVFTTGSTAQGVVSAGVGGSTTNAYYLKIMSTSKSGGQVINFSNRFTLTGMTGTFPATVESAITALAGSTAGPPTEDQVANNGGGANTAPAAGVWGVPYSLQTGLTRYAPMQGIPPTKITGPANPTPLFPTSAFTIATGPMPIPTILTTQTQPQTFSVSSTINMASAASQPAGAETNAQQRFLERWRD